MRLIYIGPQIRTPWVPGLTVDVRPVLSDVEGEAELVVIDPGGVAAARARFPRARVLARVERREDVAAALTTADDAVLDDDHAELAARALRWARRAAEDRRAETAARRIRTLEQNLAELSRRHAALVEIARTDELTRLGNRRSFGEALRWGLEFSVRYGGPLSLVLLDIDGMKRINDGHGHAAGDEVLRRVADAVRESVRAVDHAARLGGDEFGVVMPSTRAADAATVADRIRERIEALVVPTRLTASLGVAAWRGTRESGLAETALVERADAALYAAKRRGKNRVQIDEEKTTRTA